MRVGGSVSCSVVAGLGLLVGSGCVSLDNYKRMEAANRQVIADKDKVGQDLFDERSVNDSLRSRVRQLESENSTKDEMIGQYRRESDLNQKVTHAAADAISKMAQNPLGPVAIVGPKLPAQLDSALKKFAEEHPNEVSYDAARGSVKWKADLLFALGSDEVKPGSAESLRSFTDILKSPAAADFETVVVGHTDTRPISRPETKSRHPTNWHLSTNRAVAVAGILQKNGYPATRIGAMGCSEYRPVTDNASESGSSQNRRVEIYLVVVGSIVYGSPAGEARAAIEPPARSASRATP